MLQVFGRSSKFKKWLWKWGVFGYIGYGAYIRAYNSSTPGHPSMMTLLFLSFKKKLFFLLSPPSLSLLFFNSLLIFFIVKISFFPQPTLTDKQHSSASPRSQPASALKKYISLPPNVAGKNSVLSGVFDYI